MSIPFIDLIYICAFAASPLIVFLSFVFIKYFKDKGDDQ